MNKILLTTTTILALHSVGNAQIVNHRLFNFTSFNNPSTPGVGQELKGEEFESTGYYRSESSETDGPKLSDSAGTFKSYGTATLIRNRNFRIGQESTRADVFSSEVYGTSLNHLTIYFGGTVRSKVEGAIGSEGTYNPHNNRFSFNMIARGQCFSTVDTAFVEVQQLMNSSWSTIGSYDYLNNDNFSVPIQSIATAVRLRVPSDTNFFSSWITNDNMTLTAESTGHNVPEPSSSFLLGIGLFGIITRRKR